MQCAVDLAIPSLPQQAEETCKSSPELVSIFTRASGLPVNELEVLQRCVHAEIIERRQRGSNLRDFKPSHTARETATNAPLFSKFERKSSQQVNLACASSSSVPIAAREQLIGKGPMCAPRIMEFGDEIEAASPQHEVSAGCRITTPDPWDDEDWCLQELARATTIPHKQLPANCMCAAMEGATTEPNDAPPVPRHQAQPQVPAMLFQASSTSEPEVMSCGSSDEVLDWNDGEDTHRETQSQPWEATTFIQGSRNSRPLFSTCGPRVVNSMEVPRSISSMEHMSKSWMEASECFTRWQGYSTALSSHELHDHSRSTGLLAGNSRNVPAEIAVASEPHAVHDHPGATMSQALEWMANVPKFVPNSSFSANMGTESVLASQADGQKPEEGAASEPADPSMDGSVQATNGPCLIFAEMNTAIQGLLDLRGRWRDESGSIYKLSANSDGQSVNVQTKRPNGKVIFTKSHIRLESEADETGFRIVWGHKAAFMLMQHEFGGNGHCFVQWAVPWTTRQPFEWTRIEKGPLTC